MFKPSNIDFESTFLRDISEFQPTIRTLIEGTPEAKAVFGNALFGDTDNQTGPVEFVLKNGEENNGDVMLVRMDSDGWWNHQYYEWSHRINIFIHVVDPSITDLSCINWICSQTKYSNIGGPRPSEPIHVVYFINATIADYDTLKDNLNTDLLFDDETTSVTNLLTEVGTLYRKKPATRLTNTCVLDYERYTRMTTSLFSPNLYKMPTWCHEIQVLDPRQFINAITNDGYGIIHATLIALTTDLRYRWDYDPTDFVCFLINALVAHKIELFMLIYAYLPNLGIHLKQSTPLGFVETVMDTVELQNLAIQKRLRFSLDDEETIRDFDLTRYKTEFISQVIPPNSFIGIDQVITKLRDAIKNNQADEVAVLLYLLGQKCTSNLLRYRYHFELSEIYKKAIELSLEIHSVRLFLVLFAWYPTVIFMKEYTAYELYTNILKSHAITQLALTENEQRKLGNYHPDMIMQNMSAPEYPDNKPQNFFDLVISNTYMERVNSHAYLIKRIDSFLKWLIVNNGFKLSTSFTQSREAMHDSTFMTQWVLRPYTTQANQTHRIPREKLTLENFCYSFVYKTLRQAAEFNNVMLAMKCIGVFRKESIPLFEVLHYSPTVSGFWGHDNRTKHEMRKSILELIFGNASYSVLKILCLEEDTLAIVQDHIRKEHLISSSNSYLAIASHLFITLLDDPVSAIPMFESTQTLTAIIYVNLYSGYRGGFSRNPFPPIDSLFSSVLAYAPNIKKLSHNLNLRQSIADFIREINPRSQTLQDIYLPLGFEHQNRLGRELSSKISPEELPDIKYLFHFMALERIYTIHSKRTGTPFYLKLFPHGIIALATRKEDLEHSNKTQCGVHSVSKEIPEQTLATVRYSGRKEHFKYPTGSGVKLPTAFENRVNAVNDVLENSIPKVPSQTPYISSSDRSRYLPFSAQITDRSNETRHYGFWGSYNSYRSSQAQTKKYYRAAVTGACIVGATLYGHKLDHAGEIVGTIRLTAPDEFIPKDFKIDKLEHPFNEHVYERYTFAILNEIIPLIKASLTWNATLYYDLPTCNYILYGLKFYLSGMMNDVLLMDYINIILLHDKLIKEQLVQLSQTFNITIVPRSTLDDLRGVLSDANKLIDFVHETIAFDISPSRYHEIASLLVRAMIGKISTSDQTIAEIYSHIEVDQLIKHEDPLLAFSRLDYAALYAYAKAKHSEPAKPYRNAIDVLGLLPQDEVHIFTSYDTLFSQYYGPLDAIVWIPTIMPQNNKCKESKIFFIDQGIEELNQLIDKGLVHLQSLLISAIKLNNSSFYLATLEKIIDCLSTMEEQTQSTSRSRWLTQ